MLDDKIIDMFLARDEKAISCCKESYGKSLIRIADNILGDVEASLEVENDVYLQAWNSIPPNEPRTYLFAFLARITRHLALDVCKGKQAQRRRGRVVELSAELEQCIPDENGAIDKILEQEELNKKISCFLRTLPKEQRQIFVRRYWYMDSISQLAILFGCKESKIKSTLFRCRNKLQDYLGKEGYQV